MPTERAVSKPNVGALSGSGRSLSIVLGTVAMPMRPWVRSAILAAPYVVSSPPMQTKIANAQRIERCNAALERRFVLSWVRARRAQDRAAAGVDAGDVIEGQLDGFRPVARRRDRDNRRKCRSRASPHLKPSIAAEAITPLIPGAGPPPTKIASVSARARCVRMEWPDAIDRARDIVGDEETALRSDGDAGRAADSRSAAALKA